MSAPEIPALYEVAKDICHDMGWDYTDPRTGVKYPAPKKVESKKPKSKPKKRGKSK